MSVGETLRAARRGARLTQAELGKLLGRNQSAISAWERDCWLPERSSWADLRRILKVRIGVLL